jgi:hypothetical protein
LRFKRKEESTWKHLSRWFVENQIGTLLSSLLFFLPPIMDCERTGDAHVVVVGVSTAKGVKSKSRLVPG